MNAFGFELIKSKDGDAHYRVFDVNDNRVATCYTESNARLVMLALNRNDHNFNGLSPAETERLSIAVEEMGEAQKAIGKILRHGYESVNPFEPQSPTNRERLESELGDVRYSMISLCEAGDVSKDVIHSQAEKKRVSIVRWLHHQVFKK